MHNQSKIATKIRSYKEIKKGSEKDLRKALVKNGPVALGIDASRSTFQFYKSGT